MNKWVNFETLTSENSDEIVNDFYRLSWMIWGEWRRWLEHLIKKDEHELRKIWFWGDRIMQGHISIENQRIVLDDEDAKVKVVNGTTKISSLWPKSISKPS